MFSRMLRFAAGLGNSEFRRHVSPILEGDLTTLEDEGAVSWYVNPITQYNIPEQQNLQYQQYGNFHYLLLRSYESLSTWCLIGWRKSCFHAHGSCVIHLASSIHYKISTCYNYTSKFSYARRHARTRVLIPAEVLRSTAVQVKCICICV